MKERRIIWTLLALIAVAAAVSGIADNTAESYAEDALKRALVTFAAARTLNGVISVVQSTEVGVGVTVAVGQILDPVNDLIERFSGVMLVAASSLGLQNVLLGITASWGVTVALIGATLFAVVTLWWPRLAKKKLAAAASRIVLVMLCIRFIIPVLVIGTNLVSDAFLAPGQEEATAALEMTSKDIESMDEEVEALADSDQSIMDRLNSAIDESLAAVNVSRRLENLKESASNATEHIVDLIVLFVLQTIILPLAFLWILVQLLKGVAARLQKL
ncbi:MAG: hypothetical protein GY785_14810 [Gammaproteobacteria bacterium]|nr:hypothetical protein [Gammaproteobacteria bacterium]